MSKRSQPTMTAEQAMKMSQDMTAMTVRRNSLYSEVPDTIGSAIDALNAGIAMVNAASERVKAFGLSPQISVNGHDYGDKVSVYVQGELVRTAEAQTVKP